MSDGREWTLTEAAKDCRHEDSKGQWSDVSRKTIQRRLDKGKFPNAYRADGPKGEGSGPWKIPLADLLAEGFVPGGGRTFVTEQPNTPIDPTGAVGETPHMDVTPGEVEQLQAKLDEADRERSELLRRAEVAEAIAEERGNALEDMRTTLRMLEAGQSIQNVASEDEAADSPSTEVESHIPDAVPSGGLFSRLRKELWAHRDP